jgi:large subunit ribosomal protein L32
MPHPKRKTSNKEETKEEPTIISPLPTLSVCPTTGTVHERHKAYYVDGNLYHKGKLGIEKESGGLNKPAIRGNFNPD